MSSVQPAANFIVGLPDNPSASVKCTLWHPLSTPVTAIRVNAMDCDPCLIMSLPLSPDGILLPVRAHSVFTPLFCGIINRLALT